MRYLIEILLFLVSVVVLLYISSRLFPQYFKPKEPEKPKEESKEEK